MTISQDCTFTPSSEEIAGPRVAARTDRKRSSSFDAFYRIGLPVALWIGFVNVAHHYYGKGMATDAALQDVVAAELVSRRCPGLRLNPAGFRELAQERRINHADLYQKRSPRLQKAANRLDRKLREDPDGECQQMFDLYGGSGPAPRLLIRA
ncbi:hypothetical protein ACRAWG_09635 [Methylobacterium sp. P31]